MIYLCTGELVRLKGYPKNENTESELQIRGGTEDNLLFKGIFSYFSKQTYVVTSLEPSQPEGSINDGSQNMILWRNTIKINYKLSPNYPCTPSYLEHGTELQVQ